jgi:DNA-binding SARP family transcriptional activator
VSGGDKERAVTPLIEQAFELFPQGVLIVEADDRIVVHNARASALLGTIDDGATCCKVLGCRGESGVLQGRCFSALAREAGEALPEVRIDVPALGRKHAVWVTAAPLPGGRVVIEVRRGSAGDRRRRTEPHWLDEPRLRIYALGRTHIESTEGPLEGLWLGRKPGQLLKYLIVRRGGFVHADEIAEAMRPGSAASAGGNVRYFIHQLRDALQPDRPPRADAFIVSAQRGYALDPDLVWIDADAFEHDVEAGLLAMAAGDTERAVPLFESAIERYKGDFLADEPYAQWALPERDRLRALASDALAQLMAVRVHSGDLDGAFPLMDRLAALQPYDMEVQRRRIAMMLLRGRRSDAVRQYEALRRRMLETFGERLTFRLSDVSGQEAFGQ